MRRARCCAPLILAALAAGCGGDWTAYEADPGALPEDLVGGTAYPTGPYGTQVGSIVEDISFAEAFFDPDMACKDAKHLDLKRTRGVQPLSFSDVHKENAYCPARRKKFLWLISSAGW